MLFNQTRAIDYMRRCDLDVLVAASPVNITYFAGFYNWMDPIFKTYMMDPGAPADLQQNYAIFPREGEPELVVAAGIAANAADLPVRKLHLYGDASFDRSLAPKAMPNRYERFLELARTGRTHADATKALLHALDASKLRTARIGLDAEGLTRPARRALADALPKAEVKNCSNLIRLLRAVKTDDEVDRLRRAAQINEEAGQASLALARPGLSMGQIVQHFRARAAALGADFDHFQFGIRGTGSATEVDYVLAEDDVMEIDFGCIWRHCFSDTGTTLALKAPDEVLGQRHAALKAAVAAATECIKPNTLASQVHAAFSGHLKAHNITTAFPHGHGLGLEVRDYPIIVADNGRKIRDDCVQLASDLPLEANMVINLEATIRMPGVGSVHIEHSFVVTEEGCQLLVPQRRDIFMAGDGDTVA